MQNNSKSTQQYCIWFVCVCEQYVWGRQVLGVKAAGFVLCIVNPCFILKSKNHNQHKSWTDI